MLSVGEGHCLDQEGVLCHSCVISNLTFPRLGGKKILTCTHGTEGHGLVIGLCRSG